MTAALLMAGLAPGAARALMAGVPPDSPEARVDANSMMSPWSGVGAVIVNGGIYSGALIGRRYVLTAAHVVGAALPEQVSFQINTGGEPLRIPVQAIFRHPGYGSASRPFPQFDAALIRLAQDAPATVAVYPLYYGPIGPGARVTMIGYGGSGRGDEGPSIGARADVKRVGRNRIDKVAPVPGSETRPGVFLFDFDGPHPASNLMGDEGLGNQVETSAATGDSGAPVFIVSGRHRAIVGVLGFVGDVDPGQARLSRFGGIGGGTLVEPLREWIERTVRGLTE